MGEHFIEITLQSWAYHRLLDLLDRVSQMATSDEDHAWAKRFAEALQERYQQGLH